MNIAITKPLTATTEGARYALNKVPEVTIIFWIIKLLSTGMGEVTSDFFSHFGMQSHQGGPPAGMGQSAASTLHQIGAQSASGMSTAAFSLSPALAVMGLILIITMVLQIKSRSYTPWKYWLNVVSVAVFGTAAADAVHLGLVMSSSIFAGILALVLIVWYSAEKTLSVHSINTVRRELFYWATVLATFMLGTALGDMTADTLNLGNLVSGFMFIGFIAVPAVAYKLFGINEIFAFWFAYIITRPLGASFADWLASNRGGLGLGTGPVSLASSVIILALVIYVSLAYKKVQDNKLQSPMTETNEPC